MKSIALVWFMLMAPGVMLVFEAGASETVGATQTTRSAGKLKQDQSVDLRVMLEQADPVSKPTPRQAENYAAMPSSQQFAGIANRYDQLFEIFEADLQQLSDIDGDGYHHAIDVSFDVDVNQGDALIYAKLYLSRDGGDWYHYYTTDLFEIHADDAADAYQVETELMDGYPPGYYDLLIEIYSLDHAYMVTSEVLDYYYLGKSVRLEDLARDEIYYEAEYVEVSYSHGAGSAGALLLFLLIIQVVIAARGFPALTPCKKR
jgi:hypothetical protein